MRAVVWESCGRGAGRGPAAQPQDNDSRSKRKAWLWIAAFLWDVDLFRCPRIMSGSLRHIGNVSAATLISRVLGLVRDMLFFALLGTGAVSSAFIMAFTLPNLFRRLLGEGALTSAVIPVVSREIEERGADAGFALVNRVLSRLSLVLVLIVVVLVAIALLIKRMPGQEERYYLAAALSFVLSPYVLLVCLAAIVCAVLNVVHRFFIPALSQVWLNLAMIAFMGLAWWWVDAGDPAGRARLMAVGVIVGGVAQLIIAGGELAREGWRPRLDMRPSPQLGTVFALLVPGLAGAAVFQVNVLVSRLLAFSLDERSAGILYLANRLLELPLGVFAIAVTTVIFPELARFAARGDDHGFADTFARGLRMILVVTVPAAAGLFVLAQPILQFLFNWGLYDATDVALTTGPLGIFALGIPFYALAAAVTRGFHARMDMRTPVRLAVVNFILNIGLSLWFMRVWGTSGLAAANVLTTVIHSFLLLWLLFRRRYATAVPGELAKYAGILAAAVVMGAVVAGVAWLCALPALAPKLTASIQVLVGIPIGIAVYLGALRLMRISDLEQLLGALLSRKRR